MPGKRRRAGKLGRKAPAITVTWGPVTTYNADGEIVSVQPAKPEPRPRKRRRRR